MLKPCHLAQSIQLFPCRFAQRIEQRNHRWRCHQHDERE
jgi:hypothetical protein